MASGTMTTKKPKSEDGAPLWVVTYGDMMSLLLTFFIILVSMSELKQDDKFKRVMESLRLAFGYEGGIGRVPTEQVPELSLIKQLLHIQIPEEVEHVGSSADAGVEGRKPRVETVRRARDVLGGKLRFERFSDRLLPGGEELLRKFAEIVVGRTNQIEVIGHATLEAVPPESGFASKEDLAFARAKRVRDILTGLGLSAEQLRVVSAADHEPLVSQAYTADRLARNRRVEIVVTKALVQEYEGETLPIDQKAILDDR